ncbi:MAG TPA: hypothetical protein VGN37_02420 [Actinocatenispora sp.]
MSLLRGDDFDRLFESFEHTAYRLEVRDRYDSPVEAAAVDRFVAGEPNDLSWLDGWLDTIGRATREGRRFARVRVVTEPLTDYSRFGLHCARLTNGAGEDIRYLRRAHAHRLGLPEHDYWLFDSRRVVRMHFDQHDRFLGGEPIRAADTVVDYNHWRDVAWHHATRRDDFAAEHAIGLDTHP